MGFNKLIERLYLKVFVGVVPSRTGTDVLVELTKGDEVRERVAQHFESDAEVAEYLSGYLAESPFHYVAYLNSAEDQGALPVQTAKEAAAFIDTATVVLLPQKGWVLYTAKPAVDAFRKRYAAIGTDFLFSPFSVLKQFFRDKIDAQAALYVLAEEGAVSAAVFCEGNLLFAHRLPSAEESISGVDAHDASDAVRFSFELDVDGIEEGLELDDINAIDDLEGIDDLHEIEDLDSLDDLDTLESFSEDRKKVQAPSTESEPEPEEEIPMDRFGKDYQRFRQIQDALQEYYSDSRYDNRFIESVYIADACGVSNDLKQYLEEELFVKVYVRRIDIASEIVDLARSEMTDAS